MYSLLQNCCSSIQVALKRIISPYNSVLRKSFSSFPVETVLSTDELTDEVLKQVVSAVESDPVRNKEICSGYVEKLCRSGSVKDAARLLQSLHGKQIYMESRTYDVILGVVGDGEGDNFEVLSKILKDVLLYNDTLRPEFYCGLAKVFLSSNELVKLLKFVDEVLEVKVNSGVIMNKMIVGFAECKKIDKALMIFNLMKELKCRPDLVTYNIVLNILGRAGLVDEMIRTFSSMKEADLVPDIISYNTMINSLRKLGRLDLCLIFFQEMFDSEVDPDLRTYSSLIDSFGRSGRVEEALGLFGQMKRRGIHPSVYIYRSMISNFKKNGKVMLAVSLSEEMKSSFSDLCSPKCI
ncbi:hypothetical protein ACHQM5_018832 [Ranunculus cassubicifolius]